MITAFPARDLTPYAPEVHPDDVVRALARSLGGTAYVGRWDDGWRVTVSIPGEEPRRFVSRYGDGTDATSAAIAYIRTERAIRADRDPVAWDSASDMREATL